MKKHLATKANKNYINNNGDNNYVLLNHGKER